MKLFPLFLTICVFSFKLAACPTSLPKEEFVLKTQGKEIILHIEVPREKEHLICGLMRRDHLPKRHGMYFDFKGTKYASMWMKNTRIPLDMLFIDENGTVVHIHERAVPYTYSPISSPVPFRAVLELPGGNVKEDGIKVGDTLIKRSA